MDPLNQTTRLQPVDNAGDTAFGDQRLFRNLRAIETVAVGTRQGEQHVHLREIQIVSQKWPLLMVREQEAGSEQTARGLVERLIGNLRYLVGQRWSGGLGLLGGHGLFSFAIVVP